MSLSTTLEYITYEKGSMQDDEWLDYLIQLRDELEKMIARETSAPSREVP